MLTLASIIGSFIILSIIFVLYFLTNPTAAIRDLGDIALDIGGFHAALGFVYVFFLVIYSPIVTGVYIFLYERALKKTVV